MRVLIVGAIVAILPIYDHAAAVFKFPRSISAAIGGWLITTAGFRIKVWAITTSGLKLLNISILTAARCRLA